MERPLGENTTLFSLQAMDMAGALPAHSTPPPSLRAAYQAEPDLARFHVEPKDHLKPALTAILLGVPSRHRPASRWTGLNRCIPRARTVEVETAVNVLRECHQPPPGRSSAGGLGPGSKPGEPVVDRGYFETGLRPRGGRPGGCGGACPGSPGRAR
ncbi:hypothetical protein [Sphaerisporangium dianthi]|uniref:Uncharacterized protein n=1 Tax=Sphaerisporangium dianthi TaxID=1436120 RepID=A0ABV9CBU1_9ACTN